MSVTAGTQSCFYLHFVDFARLHARHLEKQLNRMLGKNTFLGSEIENLYFYTIDAPKIGGFVPSAPFRFFSFFTLHWVILWLGLAGFALWRLLPGLGPCGNLYLAGVAGWAFLNFTFLVFFFGKAKTLKQVADFLGKS